MPPFHVVVPVVPVFVNVGEGDDDGVESTEGVVVSFPPFSFLPFSPPPLLSLPLPTARKRTRLGFAIASEAIFGVGLEYSSSDEGAGGGTDSVVSAVSEKGGQSTTSSDKSSSFCRLSLSMIFRSSSSRLDTNGADGADGADAEEDEEEEEKKRRFVCGTIGCGVVLGDEDASREAGGLLLFSIAAAAVVMSWCSWCSCEKKTKITRQGY